MRLRRRIPLRALLTLPSPFVGLAGVAAICVGLALLIRTVDLVRHPELVARRRQDMAHYLEWTAEARAAYLRGQWMWTLGLVVGGAVLLGITIARA